MKVTWPAKFHFQDFVSWQLKQAEGTFQSEKATSVASKEKHALYLTLHYLHASEPIFPL